MKKLISRIAPAVLYAVVVTALHAQPVKIDVEAMAVAPSDAYSVGDSAEAVLGYSGFQFGGGVNVHWTDNFSTLVSAWSADGLLYVRNVPGAADSTPGTVNTVPLSLVAQWHPLGLGWFDPYVGAGGALVFVSDATLTPGGIAFSGVESVESHNKLAFVLNAGMRFRLFGPLGLILDAKYLPFTFAGNFYFTSGLPGRSVTVKASQIDTFLGLSFRF